MTEQEQAKLAHYDELLSCLCSMAGMYARATGFPMPSHIEKAISKSMAIEAKPIFATLQWRE